MVRAIQDGLRVTFLTCLTNFSLREQVEPKFFCCNVMFSLVWESKLGFSIRQFTNNHMWFFTCTQSPTSTLHLTTKLHCHNLWGFNKHQDVPGKVWQPLQPCSSFSPLQSVWTQSGLQHSHCVCHPETHNIIFKAFSTVKSIQERCWSTFTGQQHLMEFQIATQLRPLQKHHHSIYPHQLILLCKYSVKVR